MSDTYSRIDQCVKCYLGMGVIAPLRETRTGRLRTYVRGGRPFAIQISIFNTGMVGEEYLTSGN